MQQKNTTSPHIIHPSLINHYRSSALIIPSPPNSHSISAYQVELAQHLVVSCHLSLTLKDLDADLRDFTGLPPQKVELPASGWKPLEKPNVGNVGR